MRTETSADFPGSPQAGPASVQPLLFPYPDQDIPTGPRLSWKTFRVHVIRAMHQANFSPRIQRLACSGIDNLIARALADGITPHGLGSDARSFRAAMPLSWRPKRRPPAKTRKKPIP